MSHFKFEDKPFVIWEEMSREDLLTYCHQLREEVKILHEAFYLALHKHEVIVPRGTTMCPTCNRVIANKFKKCRFCDSSWWIEVLAKRRETRCNRIRNKELKLVETGT